MTSNQNQDEQNEIPVDFSGAVAEESAANQESATSEDVAVDPVRTLEEALQAARQEAASNHERYLRSVADLENYRRRATREKEEARKYALGSFLEEVISILDNFYLGLDAANKNEEAKGILAGFNMVFQQLQNLVQQHGLEEISAEGEVFDPNWHDCVSQQPSESVQEGVVLQVIRRGYRLNGRLLRPTTVIVSSGKQQPS